LLERGGGRCTTGRQTLDGKMAGLAGLRHPPHYAGKPQEEPPDPNGSNLGRKLAGPDIIPSTLRNPVPAENSMSTFDVIAFDADDTLWHNERLYDETQAGLAALLAPYGVTASSLDAGLFQTESRNIGLFGYGIKSFTLSMIETAVQMTWGRLSGHDVLAILALAKAQLEAPVVLLEHISETICLLAARYHLMIITKGDLQDQENKLLRSGLAQYFPDIEVVSDKTPQKYATLFKNHAIEPGRLMMVGNSLRSDILPVLQVGACAAYVPYPGTWLHEAAEMPALGTPRFHQLEHLGQLPGLLETLEAQLN
jgi:putative hydrolase of the HAD superfamily